MEDCEEVSCASPALEEQSIGQHCEKESLANFVGTGAMPASQAEDPSTTRTLADHTRSMPDQSLSILPATSGRCRGRRRPKSDEEYLELGLDLVNALLESLNLAGEQPMKELAQSYLQEVIQTKFLIRRQIESKVACCVYIAAKKSQILCTQERILSCIPARRKEMSNAIQLCEDLSFFTNKEPAGHKIKKASPTQISEKGANWVTSVMTLIDNFAVPNEIKWAAKNIAQKMNEHRLFQRERKARRNFAVAIFLALKFSKKHKLLDNFMLEKILSETHTTSKLLFDDYFSLKPFLSKIVPQKAY